MHILNIEHYQTTLFRGANSCNGRVRTKEDFVEIVKDHCHFPDPLIAKIVSSGKRIKFVQQLRI